MAFWLDHKLCMGVCRLGILIQRRWTRWLGWRWCIRPIRRSQWSEWRGLGCGSLGFLWWYDATSSPHTFHLSSDNILTLSLISMDQRPLDFLVGNLRLPGLDLVGLDRRLVVDRRALDHVERLPSHHHRFLGLHHHHHHERQRLSHHSHELRYQTRTGDEQV